jgi:hypothetical protein
VNIVAFLTARLDEDERIAMAAVGRAAEWWTTGPGYPEAPEVNVVNDRDDVIAFETSGLYAEHIARHDPARVLADVAAKRAIVARHSTGTGSLRALGWYCEVCNDGCAELPALAAVYADHPDYDESWRP